MINHPNRGRVEIQPIGTSYWTKNKDLLRAWLIPAGYKLLAEMRHQDGDQGLLIRNGRTRILMMLTAGGALRSVPARHVNAAADANGVDLEA